MLLSHVLGPGEGWMPVAIKCLHGTSARQKQCSLADGSPLSDCSITLWYLTSDDTQEECVKWVLIYSSISLPPTLQVQNNQTGFHTHCLVYLCHLYPSCDLIPWPHIFSSSTGYRASSRYLLFQYIANDHLLCHIWQVTPKWWKHLAFLLGSQRRNLEK